MTLKVGTLCWCKRLKYSYHHSGVPDLFLVIGSRYHYDESGREWHDRMICDVLDPVTGNVHHNLIWYVVPPLGWGHM